MSVNVTIPVPDAYREAAITGSPNLVTIVNAGANIIGYEQSSPSKLVRFLKSNLETQSVFTFPSDGKHIHATGLYYHASTGKAYVTFFNPGRLLISEVDTTATPMTSTDVLDRALAGSMAPTDIGGDETHLYVLSRNPGAGGLLSKVALTGFAETTLSLSQFLGSAMTVVGGGVHFVGTTSVALDNLLLIRVSTASMTVSGTGAFPASLTSDLALDINSSPTQIWVSFRDQPASVYQFNSSLAVTTVATTASGDHSGFGFDEEFFWQLFSSGSALRLSPGASDTRQYTLNSGEGYMTELIASAGYLYVLQDSGIARYQIPASNTGGTILNSDCAIYGAAVAVDKRPLANTIAVVPAVSPFRVFKYQTAQTNGCDAGADGLEVLTGFPKSFGDGYGKGIVIDPSGNIIAVSGTSPNNYPYTVLFLVKLDANGNTLWSYTNGIGTTGAADATAITLDSLNNIIICGNFWGRVNFGIGHENETATSNADLFVAKYSPTGTLIWFKKSFSSGSIPARAVTCDANNNVFLLGNLNGAASFDGNTLNAGSANVPFLIKLDSNGTFVTSHVFNGGAQASVSGAAMLGNILTFCGSYFGSFNFGGGLFVSPFPNAGIGYVVQFNMSSGSPVWIWGKNMVQETGCTSRGVAMDAQGNTILTGGLSGSFNFGAVTLTAVDNTRDIFVAKYDPAGVNLWAVSHAGFFTTDSGLGVACFANGDVAATGGASGVVGYVAKIAA